MITTSHHLPNPPCALHTCCIQQWNVFRKWEHCNVLSEETGWLMECVWVWPCNSVCLRDVAGRNWKMMWLQLSNGSLEIHGSSVLASRLAKERFVCSIVLSVQKSKCRSGAGHQSNVTPLSMGVISMVVSEFESSSWICSRQSADVAILLLRSPWYSFLGTVTNSIYTKQSIFWSSRYSRVYMYVHLAFSAYTLLLHIYCKIKATYGLVIHHLSGKLQTFDVASH